MASRSACFSLLACLLIATISVATANVLVLNDNNYKSTLEDKSKAYFIKYFAPWCGHCKRLAPAWEELSNSAPPEVVVAHVDCTVSTKVCEEQEIRGYPTLKLFVGGKFREHYEGERDLAALKSFVEDVAEDVKDALTESS